MWRDEAASVTRWPVGVQLHVSPPCMGSVHVGEMECHRTGAEVHVGLEPGLRIRMLRTQTGPVGPSSGAWLGLKWLSSVKSSTIFFLI